MKIRTLPELWPLHDILLDSEKDRWLKQTLALDASEGKTSNTCAKHIEDGKVGTKDWLVQDFELSKDFGSVNCQIHQTTVVMPHRPTKVTRTTSVMEPSLIEPTNVTKSPIRAHGPWSQTDQSWQGSSAIFWLGDTRQTYCTHQSTTIGGGFLDTKGSFTGDRWTQRHY